MNKNKMCGVLLLSGLLYSVNSIAENKSVDVYRGSAVHSENVDRNYHVNGVNNDRFNTSHHVDSINGVNNDRFNTPRFNNDTVNINREVYSPQNAPYRGWNQGPVGMSNGWDNGWNHGYSEGGWGTGLVEGLIGGIAATSLFNYFFNHNSTPSVAYVNGGSSGGGSYNTSSDSPPTEDITNNTTTNNTVVDDSGSSVGYWLLGLGVLALGAIGLTYALRRPRRGNSQYNDFNSDYDYDDNRQNHRSRPRSRQEDNFEDDYVQLDNRDQYQVPNNLRSSQRNSRDLKRRR